MRTKLSLLPDLHPILIALYPLFNLYVTNAEIVPFGKIIGFVIGVIVLVTLVFSALRAVFKQRSLTNLLTTLVAFMLFYVPIPIAHRSGASSMRIVFPIVWIALFCLLALLLLRLNRRAVPRKFLNGVNGYLNYLAAAVFCVAAINLVNHLTKIQAAETHEQQVTTGTPLNSTISLPAPPDVFYIILDGYGRSDILRQYYNLDNSSFIQNLEAMGFYVADATSNYGHTPLSLSSSLNMEYLDQILDYTAATQYIAAEPYISSNRTMQEFREIGYQIINFNTGYEPTSNLADADVNSSFGSLDDFALAYFRTTLASIFPLDEIVGRERIIGTLGALPEIASRDESTFTFAHIIAPHPPFLFNADGTLADTDRPGAFSGHVFLPVEGYRNQTLYLDGLVETAVRGILEQSDTPPIIIIQGDHGPASDWYSPQERMPILNAYYLPEDGARYLYPEITPVNSFRLIFDLYFGQNFGLLPDRAYFSQGTTAFHFCEFHDLPSTQALADALNAALEANEGHLSVDDCAFEDALPFRDGLYEVLLEGNAGVRLAEPTVHLQLPVHEPRDYTFSASVDNFVSSGDQQIDVFVGEQPVTTVQVPHGRGEYTFTVPSEVIGNDPLIMLTLEHRNTIVQPFDYGFPITVSLKYYDISWEPA